MRALILGIRRSREMGLKDQTQGTVFNELMDSTLPPEELSLSRLQDEAVSLIGAGIESTRWTLTLACYHILNNPSILKRLEQELRVLIPDPAKPASLTQLEQSPYLSACVEEGQPSPTSPSSLFFTRINLLLTSLYFHSCAALLWCHSTVSAGLKGQAVSLWIVDYTSWCSCEYGCLAHAH